MTNVIQFPRGAGFYPQEDLDVSEAMKSYIHMEAANKWAESQVKTKHWFMYECRWIFYSPYRNKWEYYFEEYYNNIDRLQDYQMLWYVLSETLDYRILLEIHYLSKCPRGAYLTPDQIRGLEVIKQVLAQYKV